MPWWIALVNSLLAIATVGFAVAAVVQPKLMSPKTCEETSRFHPMMYAARSMPLGLAVAVGVWTIPNTPTLLYLLGVALIAQIVDLTIGIKYRLSGMAVGAGVAIAALAAAILISMSPR